MNISEIKNILTKLESVDFQLTNGKFVPKNFHVTEVGIISKHFIDCGGVERIEKKANFQLWDANDYEHRLKPNKLLSIIELSEKKLGMGNLEIEVEYQAETIGKYDLSYNGKSFILENKATACLALDQCGLPKQKISLKDLENAKECTPGSGCC
jgi:hypothetical protein